VRGAVTAARVILDGEIVRMVDGKPSFGALQHRLQLTAPAEIARLSREEPAALILFDVLRLEDEWLTGRPWEERRRRLEEALRPSEAVQLSPVFPRGDTLFETVARMGLEGVMAKRRAGRYYPGQRSGEWLKIKNQQTLDAVVGGWTEGTGTRAETLGALMLGIPAPQGLVYVGNVGSGFSDELLEPSAQLLRGIEVPECPFEGPPPRTDRRPHWVRPALVCEVRHLGWTVDARLRFPVFLRWRPDKRPGECEIPPQVPQDA